MTAYLPPVDALLVLQRSDVIHLYANRERFDGLPLIFIDAGTLEDAVQLGLKNYTLRRLPVDPDLQGRAVSEAKALSLLVDQRLSRLRRILFDGRIFDGWDMPLFFSPLLRLLVARQIGQACEQAFPEHRLGLLRPDNPQQFYFDSCSVPDLVGCNPARWCIIDTYPSGRNYVPHAYSLCFDTDGIASILNEAIPDAISHVPTCFHYAERLTQEFADRYPVSIDLPSIAWDVPIRRNRTLLRPIDAEPYPDPACEIYAERSRNVLEEVLGDLWPQASSREQQLQTWSQRCRMQAIDYVNLRRVLLPALRHRRPEFVLCDHDTGHNGVLFSLAEQMDSRILVLPHSAHPTQALPHARRVLAIERAGFGAVGHTVLGQRVPTRPVRWRSIPVRRQHSHLQCVCLLLNACHTEGLTFDDVLGLGDFYRALTEVCESRNLDLVVRLKPGSAAINVMAGALRVPHLRLYENLKKPLEQLAECTQLCIVYGEPSTAVMTFLDAGAYAIYASRAPWPLDLEICTPPVADGLVPSLRLDECLTLVQKLADDPEFFMKSSADQAYSLLDRGSEAYDTLFPEV